MARTFELVRPALVAFRLRPALAAKRAARLVFKRLPLPAVFILGSVLLGLLAASVPIITIGADIHFDTIFGYTRQARTLNDASKFEGMLWLGLCASFLGAAGAWVVCDKFRWAITVPICYVAAFMATWAIWRYGGF